MEVHTLDVWRFDGASHGPSSSRMNGPNPPCLPVVFDLMGAGERRFLRDDDDVGRGLFTPRQRQLYANHVRAQRGDSSDVVRRGRTGMRLVFHLYLMNGPQHLVFFEHITYDKILVSVNNKRHSMGSGAVCQNERYVGRCWRPKDDGVNVFANMAPYHEISAVPNFLFAQDVMAAHVITRGAKRGVVEVFLFTLIINGHGLPSNPCRNPLGLNPPTRLPSKA